MDDPRSPHAVADAPPAGGDPLEDAHAQALRRIQELRERGTAPAVPTPDLRALLGRAAQHVEELRGSAQELSAVLPTRVEAAVARALVDDQGGLGRRIEELRRELAASADAVARIERDLLAERLGRIEDLEAVVDLVTRGIAATRSDVAVLASRIDGFGALLDARVKAIGERLARRLDELDASLSEPLRVVVERPAGDAPADERSG
jgi:hypothetical protein